MAITVGEVAVKFNVADLASGKAALDAISKQIDQLNAKQIKFNFGGAGGSGGAGGIQQQAQAIQAAGQNIVQTNERVAVSWDKVAKAGMAPAKSMEGLSKMAAGLARGLEHTGQIAAIFGYRMSLVASPLAALGVAGSKAAINLEQSVAKAATQLDNLSSDNVQKFTKDVTTNLRQLSTEFPKTADDMANAVYYLVSTLTIDPAVAAKMIEPIAKFSTAIKSTTLDSAQSVTPILNVYKEYADGADGIQRALGAMFETIRRGKGEAADIARQVGDFLAYGKTAGATLQQQLAIFAQLTRIAGSPSEASTQLSALFRGLTDDKTIEKLGAAGIEVSRAVEGTGEWIRSTGALDKTTQTAYDNIIKKLQGADGLTGLYGQLAKAQTELSRNEQDYASKQTVSNARSLEDSRQKVALLKAQIGFYQQQKAAIEGGEGALAFTGESEFRPVFDILKDVGKYLEGFKSEEEKLKALQDILPNVRAVRGLLSLFSEGAMGDVEQWAAEMESSTGRVSAAAEIMGNTVESRMTKMYNTLTASTGRLFDEFLRDKLIVIIDKINQLIEAFNGASPAMKEMLIQFVVLATAAGPASLAFGTFIIALSQAVSLIAVMLSPVGLFGLSAAMLILKEPLASLRQGVDAAGGGMQGMAKFAAAVAVELGLLKRTDAVKFLQDMGVAVSEADFRELRDEAADFAEKLKALAKRVEEIIDVVGKVATAFADNFDKIAAIVAGGVILGAVANLVTALGTIHTALVSLGILGASGTAVAGIGAVGGAIAALPAVVPIVIAVSLAAGSAAVIATVMSLMGGKVGGEGPYLPAELGGYGTITRPPADTNINNPPYQYQNKTPQTYADEERWNKMKAGLPPVYGQTEGYLDENGVYHPPATPPAGPIPATGDFTSTSYGGTSPMVPGSDVLQYSESYKGYGTKAGVKPAGGAGTATGVGGIPATKRIMTPQEMAPGIFAQFAGPGWAGAYASQHGGRDPFSDYQSQGYADPMAAALRDKAWGDEFFKKEGRAAEQGDWEKHWYETYAKTEVPELDAEGKPTGKTKTVIGKKGETDEFTKMIEEAMKGVTDKKQELTDAYKDPPQALIDKKQEITDTYLQPLDAFKAAVQDLITWLQSKFALPGGNNTGTTTTEGGTPPGTPKDYGGPVVSSGVHRLLKGEYVLSIPEQRDIRAIMAGAGGNNTRSGDSISVNISGANANPREIAAAVISEIQWQKGRRSGKMVY